MTFSDSDWTREPPHARRAQAQRRTWALTALIALGCLAVALGWFGIEQILDARARSASMRAIDAASPPPATASAAAPTPAPAPPVAAAAPGAAPSAPSDAQAMATLEAEMRQRAREAAQQAALDAVRRKERAWERWYQRPAFCNENPTSAQMVECANHHIRARKEFEERYAAGRL
jgi:type IV secretory pathway VirB10-like protein